MQHDTVLKKVNFDLLTPRVRGAVGKTFATMFLHFVILVNLICNMKKLNLTFLPHPQGQGGRVCRQIFATMMLHL